MECITILLEDSKADKWNEALIEWDDLCVRETDESNCICGMSIKTEYHIYNKLYPDDDNKCHILGSSCINLIHNPENYLKSKKIAKWVKEGDHPNKNVKLLDKVNNTICDICNIKISKKSMTSHLKTKLHGTNLELSNNYRRCEECKKYNIDIQTPKWKKKCINCFVKEKGKHKCFSCPKYIDIKYKKCYNCSFNNYAFVS
jgi:hypothetical protein